MRIICSKTELLQGVNVIQLAVSPKTTLPILSNFLVDSEKGIIKLTSTDLEVGIRTSVTGQVVKTGQVTIPAKKFAEIIRELPDAKIEIQADESNRIRITCANSHFLINGLPKEDYPLLPEFKEERAITIPQIILQKMLKKTSFAVSTDETRYVLNGVFFAIPPQPKADREKETEKRATTVSMVATDGRRLAYIKTTLDVPTGQRTNGMQVIIPTKTVAKLIDLLAGNNEENILVSITENQVGFKIKDTILISRLIEGTFPNYEQVIPKSYNIRLKLNTKDFLQVTKRVSLLVSEKGGSVKYSLSNNKLKTSCISPGIGEAEEEMVIEYQGNPFEIAFNPVYILDALKAMDSEEVFFEFTAPLNPGLLRPFKDKSVDHDLREEHLCVLMPMRIE
jgi:DNA polymerase-3 subunit beta